MDYSVNTRPLLQESESESDFEEKEVIKGGEIDNHFVVTKDVKSLFKIHEPLDRYNLSYGIFYLLGMTTLLPWNFFITADDYWMYKLRDTSENSTDPDNTKTDLQAGFTAYISIASTVPNTLFLILNSLLSYKITLKIRMIGSLSSIMVLFFATTVFVKLDTDQWQSTFFIITIVTVVLLNIASAILSGGLFGIVGKFSARYITAVVSGQALGGIFAALAEIVSLKLGASATTSAFVYFMVANTMIVLSLAAYLILSRAVFFRFHMFEKVETSPMSYEPESTEDSSHSQEIRYKDILKKIWVYGFSVFMTFFVSLTMYPSVTVLVTSVEKGNKQPWNEIYFVPVVGYLIFSTCDYMGRILAGILQWPQRKTWLIALFSISRIVFVPLILFCNAQPRHHLPVLINSDLYYILIIVLFGLTNGYMANITLICVPRIVDAREQEMASSMMAAFLGFGLACGSILSLLMVNVL